MKKYTYGILELISNYKNGISKEGIKYIDFVAEKYIFTSCLGPDVIKKLNGDANPLDFLDVCNTLGQEGWKYKGEWNKNSYLFEKEINAN